MSIYKTINEVRKSVDGYLKKDVNIQGYKAITHDNVTAHVRQAFIDAGLIIIPELVESETREIVTDKGKTKIYTIARYKFTLANADDQITSGIVEGHAEDYGDKAAGKALSYSFKNFILKLMMLETGENDESRVEKFKPITEVQAKMIRAKVEQLATSQPDIETRMLAKYEAESIEGIESQHYTPILSQLTAMLTMEKKK